MFSYDSIGFSQDNAHNILIYCFDDIFQYIDRKWRKIEVSEAKYQSLLSRSDFIIYILFL